MDLPHHEKPPPVRLEKDSRVSQDRELSAPTREETREATREATREWDGQRYDVISDPQARWGMTVLERLVLAGDEIVLDAGCGSGRVTEALLERVERGRVVAVDASESMLSQARTRLVHSRDRVHFIHSDLLDLTPQRVATALAGEHSNDLKARRTQGMVDAVVSTATFHWITDHDRLFAVLASLIRPGGQLVAQCGGDGNIDSVIKAARSLGVERPGTWLYATAEETRHKLERAGFTDIVTWLNPERTLFPPGPSLAEFLEVVCLREYLATVAAAQRRPFVEEVIAAMPEPAIDYVRLNIVARRSDREQPICD